MKIMHITPVDGHPCFRYLIDEQRKEHQVSYVVLKTTPHPPSGKYKITNKISRITIEGIKEVRNHRYDDNLRRAFDKLLKKYKPDIIHIHVFAGFSILPILNTASSLGIRKILTLNEHSLFCIRGSCNINGKNCQLNSLEDCKCDSILYYSGKSRKSTDDYNGMRKRRIRSIINQSDKVICPSEHQRNLLEKLFGSNEKVITSYYGVREYPPIETKRSVKKVFGYIGNLSDIKGVESIIKAFENMTEYDYELRFAVIVNSEVEHDRELFKKIEKMRNAVVMTNLSSRNDVHEKFYKHLDYCIIPSVWNEIGPMTLFESFSHKIPVLINNVESLKEKIKKNKNSRVFSDVYELERIVRDILDGCIKKEAKDTYGFKSIEDFSREIIRIYKNKLNKRDRNLFFKLGQVCNNQCLYCVGGERAEPFADFTQVKKTLEEKSSIYNGLILTGGEPTLYPKFFELLAVSFYLGYRIKIQTNARAFSSKKFSDRIRGFNLGEVTVSINSFSPEVFDRMAQAEGAFKQTISGIKNLQKAGIDVRSKIILTKHNSNHLNKTLQFIRDLGIRHAMLVFPTPEGFARINFERINPRYNDIISVVEKALDWGIVHGMHMEIENIPCCFLGTKHHSFITELDHNDNLDGIYMNQFDRTYNCKLERINHQKIKPHNCHYCVFYDRCEGVYKEYINHYGEEEFNPVAV